MSNFERELLEIFPGYTFSTTIEKDGTLELCLRPRNGVDRYIGKGNKNNYSTVCELLLEEIQETLLSQKQKLKLQLEKIKLEFNELEKLIEKSEELYDRVVKLNETVK